MAAADDMEDLLSQLDNLPPPRPAEGAAQGDTGSGIVCKELPGLENFLNRVAEKFEETSSDKQIEEQASAKKSDPLEDLVRTLNSNIKGSDWLKENTAEKWVTENPELAKEYKKAAEDYVNSTKGEGSS